MRDDIPQPARAGRFRPASWQRALAAFLAACLVCFMTAAPALALVTSVKPSPGGGSVPFGPSATFTVTWNIIRGGAPNSPVVMSATPGFFKPNSGSPTVLATTPGMTRSFPGNPNSVSITETFVVPESVMRWALEHNNGQFVYQRFFADDPPGLTFVSGTVALNVTSGMGGPIGVTNVNLTFDDGTSFRHVDRNAPLKAVAHLRSTGSGLINAVWELSEANADGSAFYRPLRTVSQSLNGQRVIDIESPPLPTSLEGRENVRFRITSPINGINSPVISYFVTPAQKPRAERMQVLAPEAGAKAGNGTKFRWKKVQGAVAYRVQVLSAAGNPVASMMVTDNETALSRFVLGQLQSPSEYQWRIVALGRDGATLGESQPRAMKVR